MPLMSWNDRMSVGIASIDAEHKKLVDMLNEVYDGVQQHKTSEALAHVLTSMIDYTKAHFKHEEDIFMKTSYADRDQHKSEHDALTKQVLEVHEKFKSGGTTTLSLEVMNFLKDWLTNHIMGSDKRYSDHFKANNVA